MLHVLNIGFFIFHTLLMLFNMVGWIWSRTRRWHLLTIGATLFSWLVMGAAYGWGYCLCTDWHFQVRRQLGLRMTATSYTQLLFNQLPGVSVSRQFADVVTVGGLLLILVATAIVWLSPMVRKRAIDESARSLPDHSENEPAG